MRFYKQKRFYIPLLVLLLLFIVATALLYKPLKLVYWANEIYPKEEQGLQEHNRYMNKPFSFLIKFQPKLEDFQELNKQIQTIKRDFIIMDKIGLGEYYLNAITNLSQKFGLLSIIKRGFFGYLKIKDFNTQLNQSQMQQYQEILKNTRDLETIILKEQIQFMEIYEEFYQFLSKNTNDSIYIYKNNANRLMIYMVFAASTSCLSYQYAETLFPRIQESYIILKELKPNADVLKYINQNSYEEFLTWISKSIKDIRHILQGVKNECQ